MDAAIPADAQNAPTGIWKSRTEREIPTAPTPIIVVVNERKNNGDSNSVAKPSTESDQAQSEYRRYQRTAHRISAGSVCLHLNIAGRIAFFTISLGYQPPPATVATQPKHTVTSPRRTRARLLACQFATRYFVLYVG